MDATLKAEDIPCLREICDGLPVRHQMVLFLAPLSTCTTLTHPTINSVPPPPHHHLHPPSPHL